MSIVQQGQLEQDIETPASGYARLFYKAATKQWCYKDEDGVVTCFLRELELEDVQDLLGGSFEDTTSITWVYNDAANVFEATIEATLLSNINDAISKRHTQNTDTSLDNGNPNQVTASELRTHLDDSSIHFTQAAISIPSTQINDFTTAVKTAETTTTIQKIGNTLRYVDEDGVQTDIDLSIYLDDTNLARLVSGTLNASTGIATFTRDDTSTFTVDFSSLIDVETVTTLTESPTGVYTYTSENSTQTIIDISGFETSTQLDSRDTANRDRANHTGTQTASTISDFDIEVSNNTDVANNTSNSHASGSDNQNLFETIAVPNGTNPIADSQTDTLTFTSSDSSVTITGDASTDTIDFKVPSSGLQTKAGSVAGASFVVGSNRYYDVVFSTAFSDANYSIGIMSEEQRKFTYSNKVATGFRINSNSSSAMVGATDWVATKHGES